jgi:hypothetical protein
LLIILVAVIIQYTISRTYFITERFINDPITISENVLNIDTSSGEHIIVDGNNFANIVDAIKKTSKIDKDTLGTGIEDPSVLAVIRNDSNIQLLIDPYINYYILNNTATVGNYKEGVFVCLSFKVLHDKDCIWDLKNKVVAYLFMSDYLFIQALIKGYNLDINDVYIKKVSYTDLKNTEKMFDYLFTYMVLDSEYMNFICNQRYYINGLKDVDINRIKAYYPFVKENYNTVKYYYGNSKKANIDTSETENKDDSNNNDNDSNNDGSN